MARLEYGRLSVAWRGEASDFTPLLAEQLDQLGTAIGVDLASLGQSEVPTAGGRRIDIVAQGDDGSEFVVENQYDRADHDHLTRGLAYAVARRARGLVIVAEEHRDEFRAVAQYLNELAELAPERGVAVWLVEAQAVRIGTSDWAPLFTAVVEPNAFTRRVEQAKQAESLLTLDEFWELFTSPDAASPAKAVLAGWLAAGHRRRVGRNHQLMLEAKGPSANGIRRVVTIYPDNSVMVPFSSYAGLNTGIPVEALMTADFRSRAGQLFGFTGAEQFAHTKADWLTAATAEPLLTFCRDVATAYSEAAQAGPLDS